MSTHGLDPDLMGAVTDFFGRAVDPAAVAAAEEHGMSADLWARTTELGFPLVGIDETRGGSGGTLMDALAIAVGAGRHAVPLPVVETHLAAFLLADAAIDVGAAPLAVAPGTARDEVTVRGSSAAGTLHDVSWARGAQRVVALVEDGDAVRLLSVDTAAADLDEAQDLAGQPRDVVRFTGAEVHDAGPGSTPRSLFLRGALLRAGQMAGALDALAEITIAYCGQRHQFGRPLHAFQAVQQHLVTLAQAAETAGLSVQRAGHAALDREASFEISSAKLVAGRSAENAVRSAHQAHGAISMTREYRLQHLTRRLNTWRWEFGTEPELARMLGEAVAGGSFFAAVSSERVSPEVMACTTR